MFGDKTYGAKHFVLCKFLPIDELFNLARLYIIEATFSHKYQKSNSKLLKVKYTGYQF